MKGIVGVYGTWRATEDSAIYRLAMEIGKAAALHDFRVLTGAYSGVMEAAPRGAKQVGGKSIGYSWTGLDSELKPNAFLDTVVPFADIEQRMARTVGDANICVFFPGRTGTVAELAIATEMRAKGQKTLPLVLVGRFWKSFFAWLELTSNALEFPADPSETTELFVIIDDVHGFNQFLEQHEHHWNK